MRIHLEINECVPISFQIINNNLLEEKKKLNICTNDVYVQQFQKLQWALSKVREKNNSRKKNKKKQHSQTRTNSLIIFPPLHYYCLKYLACECFRLWDVKLNERRGK